MGNKVTGVEFLRELKSQSAALMDGEEEGQNWKKLV